MPGGLWSRTLHLVHSEDKKPGPDGGGVERVCRGCVDPAGSDCRTGNGRQGDGRRYPFEARLDRAGSG